MKNYFNPYIEIKTLNIKDVLASSDNQNDDFEVDIL